MEKVGGFIKAGEDSGGVTMGVVEWWEPFSTFACFSLSHFFLYLFSLFLLFFFFPLFWLSQDDVINC